MRIDSLVVEGFGPFAGRTFEFAPGFTLVHGPNEAGKSTLHAALYAAIGGVRRGRGRSAAEHEFDRYRPWDLSGVWRVRVHLRLADGRRIEVVQDLADKPRSHAVDIDLGRDATSEILPREGTPDASLWLGLDRRAFLATACVRQAELLAVRDEPAALQEHLQRAAATSGADATAAEALARIETFFKEHVGQRQVNSTKPLRRAMDRAESARVALDRAREQHAEYLELLSREEVLAGSRDGALRCWSLGRAARARREAAAAAEKLERARALARGFPEGAPAGLVEDDELGRQVERVLTALAARPIPVDPGGPPLEALRAEVTGVEQAIVRLASAHGRAGAAESRAAAPPAVLDLHDAAGARARIREASERVRAARRFVSEHAARRPPEPRCVAAGGATAEELRDFADTLECPAPQADPALETLERRVAVSEARTAHRAATLRRAGWVAAALGAIALVVWLVPERASSAPRPALWAGAVLAAGAASCFVLARLRRHPRWVGDDRTEIESRRLEWRLRHGDWVAERNAALTAIRSQGLPEDAAALRELAAAWVLDEQARSRLALWEETDGGLHTDLAARESELRFLLEEQGVAPGPDVLRDAEAFEEHRALCGRRDELALELARREREARAHAEAVRERQASEERIAEVAQRCGVVASDSRSRCAGLEEWLQGRRAALERQERRVLEWAELDRLLGGRTLDALEAETQLVLRRAHDLAAPFEPQEVAAGDCDDAELERRERDVRAAESALQKLQVEIQLRAQTVPRVSELEEALREAEQELERVQRLEVTLSTTRELLRRAQDRVHRDVAPVLAAAVRESLPAVTSGRYDDVRIDPEKLAVQVHERGGDWRAAEVLSHGTAEQIYMLLRMAMARHLVRRGETCPLLLDDVTVQFDRTRKQAVLDTLHRASSERQVILLTQEDDVLEWARTRLAPPGDGLLVLEAPR